MPKQKYKCSYCKKEFQRYASTVRSESKTIFCSKKCQHKYYKETDMYVGKNNPNYKDGKHLQTTCDCGNEKDFRAKSCSRCAKKSYSVGSNGQLVKKEIFIKTVNNSKSIIDVSNKLNVSRTLVSNKIKEYDLNMDHFVKCNSRPYTIDHLTENSELDRQTLKRIVLNNNLLELKCNKCGIIKLNSEYLVLELHHIDGDPKNNIISNLEILCPNCHSQTKTLRGKNK